MGSVRLEVENNHLASHQNEREFINVFLKDFDVTYANEIQRNGTTLSVYILYPTEYIKESYSIDKEILLVYSMYTSIDARTIQLAETIIHENPFRFRVDFVNYFLVSNDDGIKDKVAEFMLDNQATRVIIPLPLTTLIKNNGDDYYIRGILDEYCFGLDLFNHTLPLTDDAYYFGRQDVLGSYIASIKRCENKGIFGLRKTGKTSFLLKLKRWIIHEKLGQVFYYDCKQPSIRTLHWTGLLDEICYNMSNRLKMSYTRSDNIITLTQTIRILAKRAADYQIKLIVMFDEIEYISFLAKLDPHWRTDYIHFWQTMWAVQSVHKSLVFVLCGVNPSIVEFDTIDGIQNPLFGIVQYEYLTGLEYDDVRLMIKTIGRRMGMKFDEQAYRQIYERYGGHPLLTRLACSWVNKELQVTHEKKPYQISTGFLQKYQKDIESGLVFYCRHVISELKEFYPEEYEMLQLLSSGQIKDFLDLACYQEYIRHLVNYGLVVLPHDNLPKIKIPVIGLFVGQELAVAKGRNTIYAVIEVTKRDSWIKHKTIDIITEVRNLERLIKINGLPSLFGHFSFPEADHFVNLEVVASSSDFCSFINVCNRCFVESIEQFGKTQGDNNYFWGIIKNSYENLHSSLERIKVYRIEKDHLIIKDKITENLAHYLAEDLEDKNLSDLSDGYFILQQRIMDKLQLSIIIEENRISDSKNSV